jgi:hypothetical protein
MLPAALWPKWTRGGGDNVPNKAYLKIDQTLLPKHVESLLNTPKLTVTRVLPSHLAMFPETYKHLSTFIN